MSRNFTPDQDLIDLLASNNTEAFEELYHRHCIPLYSYCLGKLHSPEDAGRIVRNLFISLWNNRHELPGGFSISTHFYLEVRKAVVHCVNEKLNEQKDMTLIREKIIPGFTLDALRPAIEPVQVIPQTYTVAKPKTESWWQITLPDLNLKGFRYAFQRVMHLW